MKKQKSFFQKSILSAVFMLAILGGFGFGISEVRADDPGICTIWDTVNNTPDVTKSLSQAECAKKFEDLKDSKRYNMSWVSNKTNEVITKGGETMQEDIMGEQVCQGMSIFSPTTWFNCFLIVVLRFLAGLLKAASVLFYYIVEPSNFLDINNNDTVYAIWTIVRDTLNVAFILTLLFTAFGIVFQVDKFSNKKIILTVILMALLVNFSFPIARFIIDVSNVLMYYFLNSLDISTKANSTLFAEIARDSALGKILYQNNASANTAYLLASVIFTFILTVTLFVIAILFLVRVVVLTILVIFSPIAFVGVVVPFFSKQAGQWWDNLFKYSFFGPVMVFMIYVATEMMSKGSIYQGKMYQIAQSQSPGDSSTIAAMAFFAIPIVIIWIGLAFAQSISIFGAGFVTGQGTKFMKWAGKGVYRAPMWAAKQTGVPGGVKKRWDKSWMGAESSKKAREKREDWVYSKTGGPIDHEQEMRKKAEEYKKENISKGALIDKAKMGDAGAAYRLALDGNMDKGIYGDVMEKVNPKAAAEIINKTKEKNISSIINHEVTRKEKELGRPLVDSEKDVIYENNLDEMNVDQLSKQKDLHEKINSAPGADGHQFYRYIFKKASDDPKFHEELFKKLTGKQRAAYRDNNINPV